MKNNGFTLIEVIIYIALFTLLMGSGFVTAFQLIDGTRKIQVNTAIQVEGDFIMRKLDWALTGLDRTAGNLPSVSGAGCAKVLRVNKLSFPENPIIIKLNPANNSLVINKSGGVFEPISTINIKVTCFQARIIPSSGFGPSGVTATTTINGIDFSITKYFRK